MLSISINHIYLIYIYIYIVKLATFVEGGPKAPLSIATTLRCSGGRYSIPWIAPTLPHLIMLRVKQGGIKYHLSREIPLGGGR